MLHDQNTYPAKQRGNQNPVGNCHVCGEPLFTDTFHCQKCVDWHLVGLGIEQTAANLRRVEK